jgi:hypothetical protein
MSMSMSVRSHENPSRGSRVVPCGRKDGRTDGHYAFFSFMNAPKKELVVEVLWTSERQYSVDTVGVIFYSTNYTQIIFFFSCNTL